LGDRVRSSHHSLLYHAIREADSRTVLLKLYLSDRQRRGSSKAQHEFDTLRRVESTGIPRALDLDWSTGSPVLVLECVSGQPLSKHLRHGPFDLEAWMDVAIMATEILEQIHAERILHKDLTPDNILFDPIEQRVWICDFGLSGELGSAARTRDPLDATAEESLNYISPEQTGRMNRGCDIRSDLYSLGATLYHLLTGRPPFSLNDPIELVHAHLARLPDVPCEIRTDLPALISDLILKLLAKEPHQRYQSARTLHHDLVACRDQYEAKGRIDSGFVLASADAVVAPRFEPKLYGREAEVTELVAAFELASQGRAQLVWLEGPSGAGKSSLVEQLRPRLTETRGYLLIGKFDLYGARPYSAWISAISSLVQQLLIESDTRLDAWRKELATGLGPVAGALVDLVPDLEVILGEVPLPPPLESREALARLSLALQRLISVCATTDHPLAIFIDDVQWSDAASRKLLQRVLQDRNSALLLIGASRDTGSEGALAELIARETSAPDHTVIPIAELSSQATLRMLADALGQAPEQVAELAEFAGRRVGRLPTQLRDFVEHLHVGGLLRFEPGRGWTWDLQEIARVEAPDSAVELLNGKLDRLSEGSRWAIELASCVGDEFDVHALAEVSGRTHKEVSGSLFPLSDAGLIIPSTNGFRFAHDRIREHVQSGLSDVDRARVHASIAHWLLAGTTNPETSPRAAEIAEHLNRIPVLPEELRQISMRLNLAAGRKSLSVGATESAAAHFEVARVLMDAEPADIPQELEREIYRASAEGALQRHRYTEAIEWIDRLDPTSLSALEVARVESLRIQVFALCKTSMECVRLTLEVLARLGVRWPLHPWRLRAQWELWQIARTLERRKYPELVAPAKKIRPQDVAQLLILRSASAALARVDVNLAVLATCLSLRSMLRDGFMTPPGFGIAVYSTYLYLFLGQKRLAERLARLALDWTQRMADPARPRTRMMVEVLLHPFLKPRREALASIDEIEESARECGDLEFAHYARFNCICYLALAGDPVAALARKFEALEVTVSHGEQWADEVARCSGIYRKLGGHETTPDGLDGAYLDQLRSEGTTHPHQRHSATLWLLTLATFGLHRRILEHARATEKSLFQTAPFVHVTDYVFYRGLACGVLAGGARSRERRLHLKLLRKSLRHLVLRARHGPDFLHMANFLHAEQQRLAGHLERSRALYEQTAKRAREQGFVHHEALAHERHASLLANSKRYTDARVILRKAVLAYSEWGARGKVKLLEHEHPGLHES